MRGAIKNQWSHSTAEQEYNNTVEIIMKFYFNSQDMRHYENYIITI